MPIAASDRYALKLTFFKFNFPPSIMFWKKTQLNSLGLYSKEEDEEEEDVRQRRELRGWILFRRRLLPSR